MYFEIWSRMGSDVFQFPPIALKAGKYPAIVHDLDIGLTGGRERRFGVSLPTPWYLRAFASYDGCGNRHLSRKGPSASPASTAGRSAGHANTVYTLCSRGPGEEPPKPPPGGWRMAPCSHLFFVPGGGEGGLPKHVPINGSRKDQVPPMDLALRFTVK